MSREELELVDVEKQMEEQLVEQHKQVRAPPRPVTALRNRPQMAATRASLRGRRHPELAPPGPGFALMSAGADGGVLMPGMSGHLWWVAVCGPRRPLQLAWGF